MIHFGFLEIQLIDIIDIFLVALLLYLLYKLLKGTIAFNVFMGLASVYFIWWIVRALEMKLLATILGQFINVGVILVLIVFQQEIRKFLLIIGQSNVLVRNKISFKNFLPWNWNVKKVINLDIEEILKASKQLSETKTGALIVLAKIAELKGFAYTGTMINSDLSSKLLLSIFFKNSTLHDGAVIIVRNKIRAASCILPVSDNTKLPDQLGLRHRAAIGITEQSDAMAIVISEETGSISTVFNGQIKYNIGLEGLKTSLEKDFLNFSS